MVVNFVATDLNRDDKGNSRYFSQKGRIKVSIRLELEEEIQENFLLYKKKFPFLSQEETCFVN